MLGSFKPAQKLKMFLSAILVSHKLGYRTKFEVRSFELKSPSRSYCHRHVYFLYENSVFAVQNEEHI